MSSDNVPEGRCGFVLEPGDLPEHAQDSPSKSDRPVKEVRYYDAGSDDWYADNEAVCCWRPVWDADEGRCIWHANTDDKPADALIEGRAEESERLDGAYVPAVKLGDAIDFQGCRLWAATFDGTELSAASFVGVDGWFARFPDADLWEARFPDANLRQAQFPDANLRGTRFRDSDLREVKFPDADLWGARFPGVALRDAQFPGTVLIEAEFLEADLAMTQFPDASLGGAQFLDTNLVGVQFPNADLSGVQFTDANLVGAQFSDADLSGAQFHDADLWEAQFPNANLRSAQFPHTDLRSAHLTNADATGASFAGATVEGATLTNADLADADLTAASLHETRLVNVHINAGTDFGWVAPTEAEADWFAAADLSLFDRLRWWLAWWHADTEVLDTHRKRLNRAETIYGNLQRLYRENSMPKVIDRYHVRVQETHRKRALMNDDRLRWLSLASQRWVMGYATRPARVVGVSVAVVGLGALLYPIPGIRPDGAGDPLTYPRLVAEWPASVGETARVLAESVYFSTVTFTTLGYGDVAPVGWGKAVATVESFVGAFLLALLVYVLGRRAAP